MNQGEVLSMIINWPLRTIEFFSAGFFVGKVEIDEEVQELYPAVEMYTTNSSVQFV